jgi:uncharacterized membrane protein
MLTKTICGALFAMLCFACTQPIPNASESYNAGGGGDYGADYTVTQPPANEDCAGMIPSFDQVSAFATCSSCHASSRTGADRHSAPASVNFDTAAAADKHGEAAVNLVRAGSMPPPGSGFALSAAEKEQLYEWVMCRN